MGTHITPYTSIPPQTPPPQYVWEAVVASAGTTVLAVGIILAIAHTIPTGVVAAVIGGGVAIDAAAMALALRKHYTTTPRATAPERKPELPAKKPSSELLSQRMENKLVSMRELINGLSPLEAAEEKGKGKQLERKINSFRNIFQGKRNADTETYFGEIDEMEKTLRYLCTLGRGVASSSSGPAVDSGIHDVAHDGNCLFHSALYRLQGIGKARDLDHLALRRRVVDWMNAQMHDEAFAAQLTAVVMDTKQAKLEQIREALETSNTILRRKDWCCSEELARIPARIVELEAEKTRWENYQENQHLEEMRKEEFFGGNAEVYAIAALFQVRVMIKYHNESNVIDVAYGREADPQVILHYYPNEPHYKAERIRIQA